MSEGKAEKKEEEPPLLTLSAVSQLLTDYQSSIATVKQTRVAREKSAIYGLRQANNKIKQILIDTYLPKSATLVMDLCCGQGGDLGKYSRFTTLKGVHGIDCVPERIEEAKRRATRFPKLKVDLRVGDVFELVPPPTPIYDMVSLQFSLHHLFTTSKQIIRLIEWVRFALVMGGTWIVTTIHWPTLKAKLVKNTWKNSLCVVQVYPHSPKTSTIWTKYRFTLANHMAVDEFAVDPEWFVLTCKNHGFRLREQRLFSSIATTTTLSKEETELFSLYTTFALERVK